MAFRFDKERDHNKINIMFENAFKNIDQILHTDSGSATELDYVEQTSWILFLKYLDDLDEAKKTEAALAGKKYSYILESQYRWDSWACPKTADGKIDHHKALTGDDLNDFVNHKLFPYLKKFKNPDADANTIEYKIGEIFSELKNKISSGYKLREILNIVDGMHFKLYEEKHELSHLYEAKIKNMGNAGRNGGEYYTPRPLINTIIKVVNPKIGERIYDGACGSAGFLCEAFNYLRHGKKQPTTSELKTLQDSTFFGQEKKPIPFLIGMMNMILHRILVPNLIRTNTLMEDVHSMPESQKVDTILTNPPFGGKENKSVQNNYPIPSEATEALALQYVMRRLKIGGKAGLVLPEGEILFGGGAMQQVREELLTKFNVTAIISLPKGVFSQMGADSVKTDLIFFEKTGPTKEIWFGEAGGKFTKSKTIRDVSNLVPNCTV